MTGTSTDDRIGVSRQSLMQMYRRCHNYSANTAYADLLDDLFSSILPDVFDELLGEEAALGYLSDEMASEYHLSLINKLHLEFVDLLHSPEEATLHRYDYARTDVINKQKGIILLCLVRNYIRRKEDPGFPPIIDNVDIQYETFEEELTSLQEEFAQAGRPPIQETSESEVIEAIIRERLFEPKK